MVDRKYQKKEEKIKSEIRRAYNNSVFSLQFL